MPKFCMKLLPDLDSRSASNLLSLINTCKSTPCSIALGAGMSASAGLPTWDTLLRKISYSYFEHWIFNISNAHKNCDYRNPPQNISIAFTEGYEALFLEEKLKKLIQEKNSLLEKTNQIAPSEQVKYLNEDFDENHKVAEIYTDGVKWSNEKVKAFLEKQNQTSALNASLRSNFLNSLMNKNSLLVAQMIKNRIKEKDWNYLLRKVLYGLYENKPFQFIISPLMDSCINLIKNSNIEKIVNYNYDDTMYHALLQRGIKFDNVYCGKKSVCNPSIYYPHGYIPIKGGVNTEIVLVEQEYQKQSSQVDLWSNNIQLSTYSNTSCIFLGLSLEDPNLRRILNMSNTASQKTHYAFLPKSSGDGPVPEMIDSLFDADLLRFGIKSIRYPLAGGSHERLTQLLSITVKVIRGELSLI
ncbi:SIR2 family protein [Clostridium estertheticum]|uniref:SIR2 family protein n=1 Tax=Clostridium estertheticum TaxID=238834 RepID=UPI001C0C5BE2|nr:SIR2 family protein [Clostridium estertheticum]MBU3213984.1 SIR2 family protein [Clostridium estertheticum]WAG54985.1 SIR2 family protein [Clostridium estertheticum]